MSLKQDLSIVMDKQLYQDAIPCNILMFNLEVAHEITCMRLNLENSVVRHVSHEIQHHLFW